VKFTLIGIKLCLTFKQACASVPWNITNMTFDNVTIFSNRQSEEIITGYLLTDSKHNFKGNFSTYMRSILGLEDHLYFSA
jgi:hypothetical protein